MPATYEPIATTTLSNSTTTSVTFSSIPSTYTDLVLVSVVRVTKAAATNDDVKVILNGNTTNSLYSNVYLYGTGSANGSGRVTGQNSGFWMYSPAANATAGVFEINYLNLMSYSNTSTHKSILSNSGSMADATVIRAGLWASTEAINSVAITTSTGTVYFVSGTTFSLYGIKAA